MKDEIESQVIEESDVGSAEDVLGLGEATAETPESVPEVEVEKVADIETGKLEGKIKAQFIKIFNLVRPLGDVSDHSPTSRRHHIKCGKTGLAVMFYNKSPSIHLNFLDEGAKKRRLVKYPIVETGVTDLEGNAVSQKEILRIIRAFKKVKGL